MKLLVRLIVITAFFFALRVSAEPVNLLTVYKKAMEYDAQIRAAKADNLVYKEEIGKALSQFRPKVSLNTSRGRDETNSTTQGYYGPVQQDQFYNSRTYDLALRQPLINRSSYAEYKQAKAVALKSEEMLHKEEFGLIVRISEAYCNALFAEDNLEFSHAHIKASLEQLQQTKRRFEKGYGTITEINEAQAEYEMALAEGVEIVTALEFSRRELGRLTGMYSDELCKLIPEKMVLERPLPANVDSWIDLAHSDSHEIAAARQEIQIARREVEKQGAARYPTVDLILDRNYSESGTNYTIGSKYGTNAVSLQMSVPIYTGGYISANVRQAKAKRLKAQEQLSWQERGVESDVRKYYNGVVTSIAQIKAYEQAVKSHEIALTGTTKGFEAGQRSNVDVLNAQQKLFESKRNLARSRYQYILNRLHLKESAGVLSSSEVDEMNSWLSAVKK
jgi:protease secretion system outer membrane protein